MNNIADIACFNQLMENNRTTGIRQRSFFVFNDEEINGEVSGNIYSHQLVGKIDTQTKAWMDEIEDMRTIGTSVEAEASGEETQLDSILQDTVDRLEASVTACRQLKIQLRKKNVGKEQPEQQPSNGGSEESGEEGDLGLGVASEEE